MRNLRAGLALAGAAFFWAGNFVAGRALTPTSMQRR